MKTITLTLDQLRDAGLNVAQHTHDPRDDEWFAGFAPDGTEMGPYPTAEEAALAGIRFFLRLYEDYKRLWDDAPADEVEPVAQTV